MDIQIKIKILKSFVDGLQKPFYKNKEERISQKWGPKALNPKVRSLYQNLWMKTFGWKPLDKHSLYDS